MSSKVRYEILLWVTIFGALQHGYWVNCEAGVERPDGSLVAALKEGKMVNVPNRAGWRKF